MAKIEGHEKYRIVEEWLNSLKNYQIAAIEKEIKGHPLIDREFVIETILENCNYDDDVLDGLYTQTLNKK